MLLKVDNLNIKFNTSENQYFDAVKNLSFQLDFGEILGIIGESGSGKTVATQALTGLIKDAKISGNALFRTSTGVTDLLQCNEEERRQILRHNIAYIFQEPMTALNPLMRCGDQLAESLEKTGDQKTRCLQLLGRVELKDPERMYRSFPHELSGGQRQRIMIAMALAKHPGLLIADEPTTALDISVRGEILHLLKKICKEENLAIIFITHDLISLRGFADKVLVMYKGALQETGPASAILNKPEQPYTQALLDSRAGYSRRGRYLTEVDTILKGEHQVVKVLKHTLPADKEGIRTESLSKWYDKRSLFKKSRTIVLEDVSFTLYRGDSLGLIGESGSGKSTIARILLNLLKASAGEVFFEGVRSELVKNLPDKIQMVFQDPYSSLNPKHTVGSAISEVLRLSGTSKPKEEAMQLLNTVGLLASDYNKYPHEFSGGQRQRVCIAKALARKPEIIVLDESVSALDVSVQAKILNLLNELKHTHNLTYLLISHDMNVISYFCNRIAVLKQGKIVEMGPAEELIEHPKNEYTKVLLSHSIN